MPLLLPTEHLPTSFASVGQDSAQGGSLPTASLSATDTASDWMDAMAAWGSVDISLYTMGQERKDVRSGQ